LHRGDAITAFDGKPMETGRDLAMAVADTPDARAAGMTLAPLTSDARDQYDIGCPVSGALVQNATPGGNADESGLQAVT
jgi:S1-C subfamily serine protease